MQTQTSIAKHTNKQIKLEQIINKLSSFFKSEYYFILLVKETEAWEVLVTYYSKSHYKSDKTQIRTGIPFSDS